MKKIYAILPIVFMLLLTGCDDKLDIKPLGKTTLDSVDDLESLINQIPIMYFDDDYNDLEALCDNCYKKWDGVPDYLANKNSIDYAIFAYDETVDRADLTPESSRYEHLYRSINYMNVMISKLPEASGDADRKKQLIAEARVLRAWYHFLLVGIYAGQYDASTAAGMGGVPYVDNTNVQEMKTKLTLAQTYDRILDDCSDEVLADLIQTNVTDPCRFGVDFGYGVRARVLMQMKRYDDAMVYAQKAIAVNGYIEDRSVIMNTGLWQLTEKADNNYYLIYNDNSNLGDYYGLTVSPDVAALISPDNYINKYQSQGGIAWDMPYPVLPDGALQCQIADIRFNVWGLRAESMYYLVAECQIRKGNIGLGIGQIDRVQTFREENYVALAPSATTMTEAQAMSILQDAKRLEFIGSFENFFDRKRWNSESAYAKSITRDLGEYGTFTLRPDSPLWIFPFPANAVNYNPSLTQNY